MLGLVIAMVNFEVDVTYTRIFFNEDITKDNPMETSRFTKPR